MPFVVSQGKRPFMGWILVQLRRLCPNVSCVSFAPEAGAGRGRPCVCSPFLLVKRPRGPLRAHRVAQANHLQKKSPGRQEVSRALGFCLCRSLLKTLVCGSGPALLVGALLPHLFKSKGVGPVGWVRGRESLQLNPETRVQSPKLI